MSRVSPKNSEPMTVLSASVIGGQGGARSECYERNGERIAARQGDALSGHSLVTLDGVICDERSEEHLRSGPSTGGVEAPFRLIPIRRGRLITRRNTERFPIQVVKGARGIAGELFDFRRS